MSHDAQVDAGARRIAREYCAGVLDVTSARHAITELAMSTPIVEQAINVALRRLDTGVLPRYRQDARRELVEDRVHDLVVTAMVGRPDKPPLLQLAQIAEGVRFTTWLRTVLYGRAMEWCCADVLRAEKRRANVVSLEGVEAVVPGADEASAVNQANALLHAYLADRPSLRGRAARAMEAWYLSQALGIKTLLPPPDRGLRDALACADADDVRAVLLSAASGDAETPVGQAMAAMLAEHSAADRRALSQASDAVLDLFIKVALSPSAPLPQAEVLAVRDAASAVACPGYAGLVSRPPKVRLVHGVVRAWAVSRAETPSPQVNAKPKPPEQIAAERADYEAAVGRMVDGGVTVLGRTADEVSRYLEQLLTTIRSRAVAGHDEQHAALAN